MGICSSKEPQPSNRPADKAPSAAPKENKPAAAAPAKAKQAEPAPVNNSKPAETKEVAKPAAKPSVVASDSNQATAGSEVGLNDVKPQVVSFDVPKKSKKPTQKPVEKKIQHSASFVV